MTTLLAEHVKIVAKGGANAAVKILALIAGMVCGADSIDDMDLLRPPHLGRVSRILRLGFGRHHRCMIATI